MTPIDTTKPLKERMAQYMAQTENPYRLEAGKISVELSFAKENAPPLEKLISDYFIRKKAE